MNNSFANKNLKKIDEKVKDERYKESEVIKKYLKSQEGIKFLINYEKSKSNKSIFTKVDELIDFYTTWANGFPTRGNLKMNKYEFLKYVEDFCMKNDISEEIGFLD